MQANARVKQVELARELGVAQSTVLERVRRLEDKGFIKGYKAIIDPEKLELAVQAFVSVTLKRHGAEILRKFEDGIRAMSFVRTCYHLTGRFDYLLHVAVKDLEQLGALVKTQIASLPGFGKSETFVIFSEVKADIGWPVDVIPLSKEKDRGKTGGQNKAKKKKLNL